MEAKDRLIVALDLQDRYDIHTLARRLIGEVGMVKVGLEAFTACGPDLVRELHNIGLKVFLDLKLHDIPRTAGAAAKRLGKLGVEMLTVHASGGGNMVRAVRNNVPPETKVIAVTVLTSLDSSMLHDMGFLNSVKHAAYRLAYNIRRAGADGLVCSTWELNSLRSLGGVRVVPGIRPAGPNADDQRRISSPAEAVREGADWIVVGRPILQAESPVAAARAIVHEIQQVE